MADKLSEYVMLKMNESLTERDAEELNFLERFVVKFDSLEVQDEPRLQELFRRIEVLKERLKQ